MGQQIFISYSKKDKKFADKLADDLKLSGFTVWLDRELTPGKEWWNTIEKNLKESHEVVVIVSFNSMASDWVRHEGSMAYAWEKKLYPVVLEEVHLPPWLEKYQWVNFQSSKYEDALAELILALTPPNPVQDLLDTHLEIHRQTGELIGDAALSVIQDDLEKLILSKEAKELVEESMRAQKERLYVELQKARRDARRNFFLFIFAVGLALALGIQPAYRFLLRWQAKKLGELVEIRAGEVALGDKELFEEGYGIEYKNYYIEHFFIEAYEVTNGRYVLCIKAGACTKPASDESNYLPENVSKLPVTSITQIQAAEFCAWIGRRLPTDLEWERAARGTTPRNWPWGDDMPTTNLQANFDYKKNDKKFPSLDEVASAINGASEERVYDLAGNAWEWTGTQASIFSYFIRGGGVDIGPEAMRGTIAYHQEMSTTYKTAFTGFRCVEIR